MNLPDDAYRPSTPDITSVAQLRSPELYSTVLGQFNVETTPRYQPSGGHTFCNIYVWDATSAMDAEIPHWVKLNGEPSVMGVGVELSANALVDWLDSSGMNYGWAECSEADARLSATGGHPAVAVWKNPLPGHSGHVTMILPGTNTTMIAQAGAHNYFNVLLTNGFGHITPRFFKHV